MNGSLGVLFILLYFIKVLFIYGYNTGIFCTFIVSDDAFQYSFLCTSASAYLTPEY